MSLILSLFLLVAADPTPAAVAPPWYVIDVAPAPVPPPAPKPSSVVDIGADELLVVEFRQPSFMLVPDASLVKVTEDKGPIRIRGKFVGGGGKITTKSFAGPQVFVVEGVSSGQTTLTWVKVGAQTAADVLQRQVMVGKSPPPPDPGPDPSPVDPDSKTVRTAYLADSPADMTLRRIAAINLVAYYRGAAMIGKASTGATYGEFFADLKKADNAALAKVLPATRMIVSDALDKTLSPAAPATPVTDAQRKAVSATFEKYAGYVEAASK